MQMVIQDFSDVYAKQPFMQELREAATSDSRIHWLDCTSIAGTDCYCDDEAVQAIRQRIADAGITDARGIHFFDGGNYHYMSKIWTDMVQEPFSLFVFDHHPDMQEPRFGNILSCGGWVLEVLKNNPFVQSVTLIGVADHLVEEIRNDDYRNKVSFIRESELYQIPGQSRNDGIANTVQTSWWPTTRHLESLPLYISIDKDALAPAYAATNWDQGSLSTEMLKSTIARLAANHKILGIDICGERARDFAGDEHHTVQEADALNSKLNCELAKFLLEIC